MLEYRGEICAAKRGQHLISGLTCENSEYYPDEETASDWLTDRAIENREAGIDVTVQLTSRETDPQQCPMCGMWKGDPGHAHPGEPDHIPEADDLTGQIT